MPQVMIGLQVRDDKTLAQVWRTTKRALNPMVRRRVGLRGRSSLIREFLLYGFEQASKDPDLFLRTVRDQADPLFGRKGRKDTASEARAAHVATWETYVAKNAPTSGAKRRGRPPKDASA